MAILTAVASGSGLSLSEMAVTTGALALFLIGLVAIGLLVVPRAVRLVLRLLLRGLAAGPDVRLLRGARRLHRRLADRGVRRAGDDRASRAAGARHVRGDLLRVGRHAD